MRKLILLPGSSARNKVWLEEVAEHFGGLFDAVYPQPYSHWGTEGTEVDPELELGKLSRALSPDDSNTQYYLFARSIGTILSLKAVHEGILLPQRCVFFGTPLNLIADRPELIGGWGTVGTFPVLTLAFHNRHDPVASYDFLASKLTETGNATIEVVPLEGDHHSYSAFSEYEGRIREFLV